MSVIPTVTRNSSPAEIYRLMISIRLFEQSLLDMFEQGVLAGTTHTCLGQESSAVGVMAALDLDKDIVFSNHRGHGHFLAYCGEVKQLYLEVMGKPGGVCNGRGGSQHLCHKNFYSNGIQGGIVPVATGMAFAEKKKGSNAIACVFLGDGTLGEGVIYETFNMASLWGLPVLFVIDNNGYAQSTPRELQLAGDINKRLEAFDIACEHTSGEDVTSVIDKATKIVDYIRSETKPGCLIIDSVRMGPHSKGDDSRQDDEVNQAKAKDPIAHFQSNYTGNDLEDITNECSSLINGAREEALNVKIYE